jgi:DNA polymerase-1
VLSKSIVPCANGKWTYGDNKVRSSFNIGGTKTGRLSSSNPNLQNIPSPGKEPGTLLATLPIKNMFKHSHSGGCLLQADYAGMELRIMAATSRCTDMIRSFIAGEDIHCYAAKMIFRNLLPPEAQTLSDKEFKKLYSYYRDRSKAASFAFLYGGDEYTLLSGYLNIPTVEGLVIKNTYFARFPEVPKYQKDTIKFAKKNGYVRSPFGRRLYLPYINDSNKVRSSADARTGINMPIQSAASDVMLCALIIVDDVFSNRGLQSALVNTVHDSLVVDVFPDELEEVKEIVIDSMENVPGYADKYFPGLDFSWLDVPLRADTEVGSHYATNDDDLIDFSADYPNYDFTWFSDVKKELGNRLRPVANKQLPQQIHE